MDSSPSVKAKSDSSIDVGNEGDAVEVNSGTTTPPLDSSAVVKTHSVGDEVLNKPKAPSSSGGYSCVAQTLDGDGNPVVIAFRTMRPDAMRRQMYRLPPR